MELKIKTEIIKDMVSRITKGVGNNKLIPLTSMIAIELKDNKLKFIATDATQYLIVEEKDIPGKDFYVTVQAEQFSKLISKLTCKEVGFELDGNCLTIGGNGIYKIDIPLDESGNIIKFPTPFENANVKKTVTVPITTIKTIINSCLPAVAVTFEEPCYTGVYIGESIMATDTQKICNIDKNLIDGEQILLSSDTVKLMAIMNSDNVDISITENNDIIIKDSYNIIFTPQLAGIDDYAVSSILPLLSQQFSGNCKITRTELITLLDRISIFVGTYDNGAIQLTFMPSGLEVRSKQSSGVEIIKYSSDANVKDEFSCWIDVNMLLEQLKAQSGDNTEVFFGSDTALEMSDGQIVQLIALLTE